MEDSYLFFWIRKKTYGQFEKLVASCFCTLDESLCAPVLGAGHAPLCTIQSKETHFYFLTSNQGVFAMNTSIPTTGFLRLPQVLTIIPISKSAWWEGCKSGRLPKPVKLAPRATAWKAEDIAALVQQLGGEAKA